ncbi:MAG: TniQ family protein [Rhodobacteraceae bacterium]|jgi:hypothetical protein|uniref:TniQ family protein n=1 Tax=Marivita sp. TaxID=2003365 RepID=UPI003B5192AB|nr:TniQ family protein [Paracoccaceae bacterium]
MTKRTTASPLRTNLRDREPAFALMSRLAAIGGTSAVDFGSDIGVPFGKVLKGSTPALQRLVALTGCQPDAFHVWTPTLVGTAKRSVNGHLFPIRPMLTPVVRGCPNCLLEDINGSELAPHRAMTYRTHWLIQHMGVCLKHEQELVPLWKEVAPAKRYDTAEQFRVMSKDVADGVLKSEEREASDFEIWFDHRLARQSQTPTWLDDHPLHAAAVFCRLLGAALLRLHGVSPSHVPASSQWGCYEMGFEVARDGAEAIRDALHELNRLAEPRLGPKGVFPILYDRLSREHLHDPDFEPYRVLLRQHLMETWPLAVGDDLLGEPVTQRKLHSVQSAAEETGVDRRRLRKLLEAAGMIDADLPDAWAVFDAGEGTDILKSLVTYLSAKEFAAANHICRSQFDLLVEDGILRPAISDVSTKHVWNPLDGRELITELLTGSISIQQAQHGWETIAKSAQRLKLRPAEIIMAIRDGRLQHVARNVQFRGYQSVHVYHDEVAQVLAQDLPSAMSLEMFSKTVGLRNPAYMTRLVKDGHVATIEMRNPRTKALQRYIGPAEAAAFHDRFVTLRILSRIRGESWQSLSSKLRDAGVAPFKLGDTDYGNIFLKNDVQKALSE